MVLTHLLFEMPMRTGKDAIKEDLALYVYNTEYSAGIGLVLYIPDLDEGPYTVGFLYARKNELCPEYYEIINRAADYEYGPLLFDIFLTIIRDKAVIADRDYMSIEARAGWKKMMSMTDKYEVTPLPDNLCARRNHINDFGEPWKYSFRLKQNLNTQYKTLIQNHKNYVRNQKNWYDIEGILVRDGNEYFREKYRNRLREPERR